ncbi:unnamed protein product [Rotaria sp. Silwood2]|nr:unnamed protein product [Rotaria sp. Silwood2]CAF3040563.1 unnamed protein product [Rotaria sp. Silwood2]CAF3058155.1 unnamed protein product [Rotaria sp. Silwood2]CAF3377625.1 unnamed protein product [Rotaria sp. Silwood2]CAF4089463.1 unnamed protein product [Rotaria sp. Silwood2]
MWLPGIDLTDPIHAIGWHWDSGIGKKAALSFLSDLKELSRNSSQYLKYLNNYLNNTQAKLPAAFSDIFYIPQRMIADWLVVTKLIFKYQIFPEIGFPLAAMVLSSSKNDLVALRGENWNKLSPNDTINIDPQLAYYHRIDHTSRLHQQFIEFVVNKTILLSLSHRGK